MAIMDYAKIQRQPDGTGKILVTTVGVPDRGSYVTEQAILDYVASHSLTQGYYYNGNFYEESSHTTVIAADVDYLYLDLASDTLFRWNGASYVRLIPADILTQSMVVDNVSSHYTDLPLSANMGLELQDQIDNLMARGRFLSLWNCVTGLPTTNPTEMPYTYKAGDYYIVSTVGSTNYKPTGSTYTGVASTTVETLEITANDFYEYDGTNWMLLNNTQKTVSFANLAGSPDDNLALAAEFSDVVRHDFDVPGSAQLVNSDLLDGHPASYFAKETEVDDIRGNSDEYDPTETYNTDDYAIQNGTLYKCLQDNVTGTWDATKWIRIDLTSLETYSRNAVFKTADLPGTATPINADKLDNHDSTYFATASEVSSLTTYKTGTVTSTYTISSAVTYLYRYGNMVFCAIYIDVLETVGSSTVLATIPNGFRPIRQVYACGQNVGTSVTVPVLNFIRVFSDGTVSQNYGNIYIGSLMIIGSWVTDNAMPS